MCNYYINKIKSLDVANIRQVSTTSRKPAYQGTKLVRTHRHVGWDSSPTLLRCKDTDTNDIVLERAKGLRSKQARPSALTDRALKILCK